MEYESKDLGTPPTHLRAGREYIDWLEAAAAQAIADGYRHAHYTSHDGTRVDLTLRTTRTHL